MKVIKWIGGAGLAYLLGKALLFGFVFDWRFNRVIGKWFGFKDNMGSDLNGFATLGVFITVIVMLIVLGIVCDMANEDVELNENDGEELE